MRVLTIDISYDLICPWCLIGKQHLRVALDRLQQTTPDVAPRLRWHSQQLLPDVPAAGLPFRDFYVQRLGGIDAVAQRQAQVRAAGQAVGLSFDFDRIEWMPNTSMAHRMIASTTTVYGREKAEALIDALMTGYFTQGSHIGQRDTLIQVAHDLALDPLVVPGYAQSTRPARHAEPHIPAQRGVRNVPHFVFDNALVVEGAVAHHVLLEAMLATLAAQEPEQATSSA